jgi:hypothetical protein
MTSLDRGCRFAATHGYTPSRLRRGNAFGLTSSNRLRQ